MYFDPDFLSKIKDKVNVSDMISRYAPIERRGRKYWASCPFHVDKTPSLMIDDDRGSYYCFSCKRGGDLFNFVEEHDHLNFEEAVEYCAKIAGLEIPRHEETPEARKRRKQMESGYECLKETARYYCNNLFSGNFSLPVEYLKSRGISESTMKAFGLGYSIDYQSLVSYLSSKGFSYETMMFVGIVNKNDSGGYSDAEAKRLIVPLIDGKGRVIGFGGRRLDETMHGKYVNTRSTPIFEKRHQLFNMNNFVKLGTDEAILVEGYFDVISLYQAGIKNALAAMGTAFTEQHCELFRRYGIKTIYVCFDGDAAGQKATIRSLDLLKNHGFIVKVVTIPDNMDPDDAVKKLGKSGFEEFINKSLPLIDYKLKLVEMRHPPIDYDSKIAYIEEAITILAELDPITAEVYIDKISKISSVKKDKLIALLAKKIDENTSGSENENLPSDMGEKIETDVETWKLEAARVVLAAFLEIATYASIDDLKEEYFESESQKAVYSYLQNCIKNKNTPKISDLYNMLQNDAEISKIDACFANIPNNEKGLRYDKAVKRLEKDRINNEIKKLSAIYTSTDDPNKKDEIKKQIIQLTMKKL